MTGGECPDKDFMRERLRYFFILIRPHQYIKNLFIFLPLFFGGGITHVDLLLNACLAFTAFSFSASAVYILNDCCDMEEDRRHPRKKNRPLASGAVTVKGAVIAMSFFSIVGISIMAAFSFQSLTVLCVYILLNIWYSFHLKHLAILDVAAIAVGFVLRLFIGSIVTGVPLSMWIVIMTFLLAMFMALAKRRSDILIFLDTGNKVRRVVDGYSLQFIDGAMMIMASVVIVSYILYTTSSAVMERLGDNRLYLTAVFVVLGIMRYLQIAIVEKESGSPTEIMLKDRFLQITVLAWLVAFIWIIYL